jgi:hypothetical protein
MFGMDNEFINRDTIIRPSQHMRDTIAMGMAEAHSPNSRDELAEHMQDELRMPSYYNPETKANYDDLI